MSRTVNVGIIGCGGIANGKHMPALSKLNNVNLVAFCDIIVERAEQAAKEYGVEGAKVYKDYKELLKDETIEVVHVLTPNREHADITIDSLYAGKHVMCEKPMAKTAADARRMVAAAKETGKKLTIGYQHRHKAESDYIKEVIENGELGEIYYANCYAIRRRGTPNWGVFLDGEAQGGGPIIDIATHSLDLTLFLMNNYEPELVVGKTHKKIENPAGANPWGDNGVNDTELEEAAWIDGAGPIKTFLKIAVPSSGVAITTVLVFSLIWHWNDFLLCSMYLNKEYPLAMQLNLLPTNLTTMGYYLNPETPETLAFQMAGCVLFVTPMLIIYMILQRKFIESIDRVGITG